jgi:hypothetical protein
MREFLTKIWKRVTSMFYFESSMALMEKPATRTFFFGYGSLMYPNGINGRGMTKDYEEKDLATAQLKDFSRGLFARSTDQCLYYGIKEDPTSVVNGVVFEVFDNYDYTHLMISEGAHVSMGECSVYKSVDITEKISGVLLPPGARVFVVIPLNVTDSGFLRVDYVARVWAGIQFWGKDFVKEFLLTGGRKYDKKLIEDRITYSRRFHKEMSNTRKAEDSTKNVKRRKGVRNRNT